MNTAIDDRTPNQTLALIGLNAIALVAFVCSPHASEYPFLALGTAAFVVVQIAFPACRPCISAPLCPANVAQAFFWLQLVGVPLLIGNFGFSLGTLPWLPSIDSLNTAITIQALAYSCFCAAFQYFSKGESPNEQEASTTVAPEIIPMFIVIGLIGFLFTFGSIGGFVDFVTSPIHQRQIAEEPTTVTGAIGSFLRHFLGFGLVLAWSCWLTRRGAGKSAVVLLSVVSALMLGLVLCNFSYNRGSMLAPLMAVAAAYSLHVKRISFRVVGVAGAGALAIAFTFGWYRSTNLDITELSLADVRETWEPAEMLDFVQIYASAPQLAGFLIENLQQDGAFYHGTTLIPSLVYPIPVLGKPYRDQSGTLIFNDLIYGDPEIVDQNLPYDAEFYMNFQVAGVAIGYAILGWIMACYQRRFISAPNAVESYSWFLLGVWTVFPGSLSVASQMYVYSFWPIYGYWCWKFVRPRNLETVTEQDKIAQICPTN